MSEIEVVQGSRFHITRNRLQVIASFSMGRFHMSFDEVRFALIDYDWESHDEHQFWLDHEPIDEIVSWLHYV